MKTLSIVMFAVMTVAACSKKADNAPAPASKAAATGPGAPAAAQPARAVTTQEIWDLAQKDDSQVGKTFTVTGKVFKEEDTRIDLLVGDDDKELVRLFFADEKSRADAVTGRGTSATATATCTLARAMPATVRLEPCTGH